MAPSRDATLCAMGHIVPTVLLIGVQKAGTTSLHTDLLRTVPGLRAAHALHGEPAYYDKEVHYFDALDKPLGRVGLRAYLEHFDPCPERLSPALLAIDATPRYIRIPGAAERAVTAYAELGARQRVRIIAVFRSPTERARSWFDHFGHANGSRARTHVDTWAHEVLGRMRRCARAQGIALTSGRLWSSSCFDLGRGSHGVKYRDALAGGMYALQLEAWLRAFSPAQIAITTFNAYVSNPRRVLVDLARFAGHAVPRGPPEHNASERHGLAETSEVLAGARRLDERAARLRQLSAAAPAAAHLGARPASTLGEDARQALDSFYRPHMRELVELLRGPANQAITSTPFRPARSLGIGMLMHDSA